MLLALAASLAVDYAPVDYAPVDYAPHRTDHGKHRTVDYARQWKAAVKQPHALVASDPEPVASSPAQVPSSAPAQLRAEPAAPQPGAAEDGQATACRSIVHTVSDDWCETTCKPGQLTGAGCDAMCCCDTSCNDDVMRKRVKDKELFLKESEADYTGTTEQCHFPQCSKDICPVDDCQLKWTDSCKGPRPVVYVADGHSGSSIITAALANLTGSYVNPWAPYWPELFGDTINKARTLRAPAKFMSQFFCNGRRMYPLSRLVGFKWKTYGGRYEETPEYDEAWQYIAEHKIPVVWVLRNTLDIIVSDTIHYEQSRDPTVQSIDMVVARNASRVGTSLADKLNSMEDAKRKIRMKLKSMGVVHHITAYELLFHDNPETRLTAWKKVLLFYGMDKALATLTLSRLDRFLTSYDKASAFNNHGDGPPRTRTEIVKNLPEVMREYNRVMDARRLADEQHPEKADPDAAAFHKAKEFFLGNDERNFRPNDSKKQR